MLYCYTIFFHADRSRGNAPGENAEGEGSAALADKANVQRLDQLPGSSFDALLQEWGAHFSAWLQDAAEQLLPAQLPAQ